MQETFKKRTSLIYIPVSPTTPLLTVEPELADSEWSGFLKNCFFFINQFVKGLIVDWV